jgi:hypothetical protein
MAAIDLASQRLKLDTLAAGDLQFSDSDEHTTEEEKTVEVKSARRKKKSTIKSLRKTPIKIKTYVSGLRTIIELTYMYFDYSLNRILILNDLSHCGGLMPSFAALGQRFSKRYRQLSFITRIAFRCGAHFA